jgi:MOSC domain-containing protein YiiM
MASLIGKLTGIYIGNPESEVKTSVETAELISGHGLRGDSHAGRDPNRQVSLFATEVLTDLQADGFKVPPERLSANLFTENIQLNSLEPGTRLRIGQTEIEIAKARRPCQLITRIDNRLPKRLYGRCGQLARVVKGGAVRTGDEIEVIR